MFDVTQTDSYPCPSRGAIQVSSGSIGSNRRWWAWTPVSDGTVPVSIPAWLGTLQPPSARIPSKRTAARSRRRVANRS